MEDDEVRLRYLRFVYGSKIVPVILDDTRPGGVGRMMK